MKITGSPLCHASAVHPSRRESESPGPQLLYGCLPTGRSEDSFVRKGGAWIRLITITLRYITTFPHDVPTRPRQAARIGLNNAQHAWASVSTRRRGQKWRKQIRTALLYRVLSLRGTRLGHEGLEYELQFASPQNRRVFPKRPAMVSLSLILLRRKTHT